jgi:hypothetical protein
MGGIKDTGMIKQIIKYPALYGIQTVHLISIDCLSDGNLPVQVTFRNSYF